MEEYKKIIQNILVPSFFILLVTISSIHLSYSFLFNSNKIIGIIIFIVALLLLPVIFCKSMKIDSKQTAPIPLCYINAIKIILLITITFFISISVFKKVQSFSKSIPIASEAKIYHATIKQIIYKRYNQELLLNFYETRDPKPNLYAVAYIPVELHVNIDDTIEFTAKPKKVDSNFSRYLAQKGIHYLFYLNEKNIKIINKNRIDFKQRTRDWISNNTDKLFSPATGSAIKALYFGNKDYVDKRTISEFKRAGVLHVLAASGLNIGIIAALPFFLLRIFRINKKIILIITAIIIYLYLYITDMPVSLIRAYIMFMIYAVQKIFDLDKNIFNTLFLSAVAILFIYPYDLYDIGFQLTFTATLGILLFFNIYKKSINYLPSIIYNSLALTLSAQIFVIPIILINMNELNLIGIISNLFIVPLINLIFIISILTNLISLISIDISRICAFLTDLLYTINHCLIKQMADFTGHFYIEKINIILIAAFILLFIPLLPFIKKRKFASISIPISLLISWLYLVSWNHSYHKNILLKNDQNEVLLINGEKSISLIGELTNTKSSGTIINELNKYSNKKLILYIPNPDYLNIISFSSLIRKTNVSRCYLSSDFSFNNNIKNFFKILEKDRIHLIIENFNVHNPNIHSSDSPDFIKNIYFKIKRSDEKIAYSKFDLDIIKKIN